MKVILETRRVH